jgi:SAM-dependent methyltransferase
VTDNPNKYYEGGLAVATYDAFYDAHLSHSPVAGDIDFYVARARETGPRVLELGAGTGRVAIPLAQAGCAIMGVDISAAMLAIARRKIAALPAEIGARIRLACASMDDFAFDETFDLALIPFRAFQHVVDPAAQRRALRAVNAHLRPGGVLVIDMFDADLATVTPGAASPAQPREAFIAATGGVVRRTVTRRENDPFAQTICEHMRLEAFDAEGALVGSEDTSFTLRWATHNEFACMLELSGFPGAQAHGDFKGGSPGYAREQVWVARKP